MIKLLVNSVTEAIRSERETELVIGDENDNPSLSAKSIEGSFLMVMDNKKKENEVQKIKTKSQIIDTYPNIYEEDSGGEGAELGRIKEKYLYLSNIQSVRLKFINENIDMFP